MLVMPSVDVVVTVHSKMVVYRLVISVDAVVTVLSKTSWFTDW